MIRLKKAHECQKWWWRKRVGKYEINDKKYRKQISV